MRILFEDGAVIVCVKPAGVSSQKTADGNDLPTLLERETGGPVFPVHRLDTGTAGLMAYAKTQPAAAALSRAIAEGRFTKEYVCRIHGIPAKTAATLEDLLFRDSRKNKSYVVTRPRKGVKPAKLSYRLLRTDQTPQGAVSLLRVRLYTGRTHQIRVQLASRKLPLLGDGKYGAADHEKQLALFSCYLSFPHPVTGESMEFETLPEWAK